MVENLPVPFDRRVWLEATSFREAGHEVHVICPTSEQYPSHHDEIDGILIYRYDLPPTGNGYLYYLREYAFAMWRATRLAWSIYFRHGFHVIHGCNPPDLFFALALLFRPLGVRFVFDQHDLSPETFKVKFGQREPILTVLKLLERLSYAAADVVIATNRSVAELARDRGGVASEDLFIVRTGPDSKRLYQVKPRISLKRGRRYLACYLGVMGPQDGVDYAMLAAAHLVHRRKRNDVHFVLIGAGDAASSLRRLCSELELDDYVEFAGRISDEDLRVYLSTADICLSPDPANGLNEFHTMNKTLEYMAMGKPVVAFDLKETRFSAGDAALYATPNEPDSYAECIERLLDDSDLRNSLGRRGRERIQGGLSWDHSKQVLLQAYSAVLSD